MSATDFLNKVVNTANDVAQVATVGQQYAASIAAARARTPSGTANVAPGSTSRVSAVAQQASDILRTVNNATAINRAYEGFMAKKWWWIGGGLLAAGLVYWFFIRKKS